ncbi:MAG: JAB domain-containing protein [Woeseiaceae bacterium]
MKNQDNKIIEQALKVLEQRMKYCLDNQQFQSPEESKHYAKLALSEYQYEVFAVLFLDNRHHLISFDKMFYGTIDSASVYPCEIARRCLEHNAAAVILAHNHPSGDSHPSESDIKITSTIKKVLSLFDIRTLDHLIVGKNIYSMAETGDM